MISKAKHMAVLYRHIRLDSNQPFYIGIGRDEKRAYSKKDRNKHWKNIVQKHGYKVHIMMDDLTWEEACEKEREFIQLYGRKDLGLGTLVNLTDGGDGTVGCIQSEEHVAKLSAARKGRVLSQEWKAKLSAANKGKKHTEEAKAKVSAAKIGKKQSEEHIAKRSAALTGRKLSEEAIAKRTATRKAWWAKKSTL
jgi:hypothetical protein